MMQVPSATISVPSHGLRVTVHPGSLFGRLAMAAVSISDPRVSEAHALVSLRARSLQLLALRGLLLVDGHEVDHVALVPGLRVELAEGLPLVIERVELPTHALLLCGAAPGAVELGAATYSLVEEANTVRVVVGFVDGAAGHVWSSGSSLWIRVAEQPPQRVEVGGRWTIADCSLRIVHVPLDDTPDTWTDSGRGRTGLVVFARYTTVHIQRDTRTSVVTGKPANLVSELVRFGAKPVPWELVSQQIWGREVDRLTLRKNFDSTMSRLRAQLRELELRDDLVGLDGGGNVELVLHPGDRIVDQT